MSANIYCYIIVTVFWITSGITSLIVWIKYKIDVNRWPIIYDNCRSGQQKHEYILRFIHKNIKKELIRKGGMVYICLYTNKRQRISRLNITGDELSAAQPIEKDQSVAKSVIYRKDPLLNIKSVALRVKNISAIEVMFVEIQEIGSNIANIGYVMTKIKEVKTVNTKKIEVEAFPAESEEYREIESIYKPSILLNLFEWTALVVIGLSLVQVFNYIAISTIPGPVTTSVQSIDNRLHSDPADTTNIYEFIAKHWLYMFLIALASSFSSIIVIFILLIIYRFRVKTKCLGSPLYYRFILFIIPILVLIVTNYMICYLVSRLENQVVAKVWNFGVLMATFLFIFFVPFLLILLLNIGFFDDKTKLIEKIETEELLRKRREFRQKSAESIGEKYYEELSSKTKAKSISGYKPLIKKWTEEIEDEEDTQSSQK